ncbi:MAG: HAMP domain-containing protein [Acidobacteriia bacterium]|nr:HAMP domain-containing protein [Terriglobia bacterium]
MTRLGSLSLLWKVLLSTSVLITTLLVLTAWLVQNYLVRNASLMLEDEVSASLHAYESLWEARAERLKAVSRILSRSAAVRAAFGTADQATIRDTAEELWDSVAPRGTLFFVTSPDGRVLASLGEATRLQADYELPPALPVEAAASRFPNQATGFLVNNGRLYQMVFTPVYVASGQGSALLNVLVAGFEVDAELAAELKRSTGSDFVFLSHGRVVASTLPASARLFSTHPEGSEGRAASPQVHIDGMDYSQLVKPLSDIAGSPAGELRILQSFEGAQQRIRSLGFEILTIWFFAVLVGLAATYLLARRIVEPVKALDLAASEIAKGNYDAQVPITSSDELGRLARTFNSMCASIRNARQELIRHERIATVGRLSTSIIHDLRNPLAAIYGGAEMLVDAPLSTSQVRRLADSIYQSSRRILAMLQELADATRGRAQRDTRRQEVCRLRDVVLAASDALADAASVRGVSIRCEVPEQIELPLDRPSMERVFQNLLGNAIEAMPGGGSVAVRADRVDHSTVISVEDTGPGIPEEIKPHLFEPFASAGKRNGMGLGLALSRQTVIDHGGELSVRSSTSHGTTFVVRLPLDTNRDGAQRQ